jgi:hypothetical protein
VVRRNALVALLAFVALWPLVHRGLVARFGIDPWKLSGFAMYATPSLPVLVVPVVPGRGRDTPLDEASLPAWVRSDLDRFRVERLALGSLREPTAEGRALLAARPDLASVAILVQRSTLEPGSARIATSVERFVYDRAAPSGERGGRPR